MNRKSIHLLLALVAFFFLTAARTAPIYNAEKIEIAGKKKVVDVQKAIQRAGLELGWEMKADRPGHILGTLHIRTHTAIVDIEYNAKHFSIRYKDSENLNHSGEVIHANYNNWIKNLERKIQIQLLS